jgi:hypothetical protein
MMRRLVASLLLCFVAVGDAEGTLTSACDVNEEIAAAVLGEPSHDDASQEPVGDNCHCAHAHLQTFVPAERVSRAHVVAAVAPIAFVESAPLSADRARLLRPPRV